jgi:hypothetical protein
MASGGKPATARVRSVLTKLEALAERGVDGEKLAAQRKIERLKAKFDFSVPDVTETCDLFHGTFKKARKATWVRSFRQSDLDVANAVKWAIEGATGICCVYRKNDLLAEAAPVTVRRLVVIAEHIATAFHQLIGEYNTVSGVSSADRSAFVMGLYDGMMNTPRERGQALPNRAQRRPRRGAKKPVASTATEVHVHPYTLAFGLGRQIRCSVPLEEIKAELGSVTQQRLAAGCGG